MDTPIQIIGQIIGIIALAFTCLSYQMRTSKQLLLMQTLASGIFSVHYLLIGAYSALVINLFAIVRNLAFYHRDKKLLSGRAIPWLFAAGMAILGLSAWQGWYTVLIALGVAINTVCLASPDAQFVRKSILITSPMIFIYDIFAFSIGGMVNETLAITSSVIGIVRCVRAAKCVGNAPEGSQEETP